MAGVSAFVRETVYRLLAEAARYWLISHVLATKKLPEPGKLWVYSHTIDWGNDPKMPIELRPLKGKRIEIEIRVVDYPPAELAKEQTNV